MHSFVLCVQRTAVFAWSVKFTVVMSHEEEREQSYTVQFLHRQGKNCVETLHAIQTMYREEALLRIPLLLFLARRHRPNLTDHAKTVILQTLSTNERVDIFYRNLVY